LVQAAAAAALNVPALQAVQLSRAAPEKRANVPATQSVQISA
jgi:hypothetical protein